MTRRRPEPPNRAPAAIVPEMPAGAVRVNTASLAPFVGYGEPAWVTRGWYEDAPFRCRDCGREEVWRAAQQKWWYEVAKGAPETTAIACRACRRVRRELRARAASWVRHRDFVLGPPREREMNAVRRLLEAGLAERFGHYDGTRNPDIADFARWYGGNGPAGDAAVVLARHGRAVVACGVLVPEGRRGSRGRIVRMSVAAAHRRAGLGGAVLAWLVARARERGYRELLLETTTDWRDAVAFYLAAGFRIVGTRGEDTHFKLLLGAGTRKRTPHRGQAATPPLA